MGAYGIGIRTTILLTDVPLTAQMRDDLSRIATESGFKGNFASVDGKEICQFLDNQSEIRRSYPQLLGLADLDVIVNRDLRPAARGISSSSVLDE